jgi:hypothetical protein
VPERTVINRKSASLNGTANEALTCEGQVLAARVTIIAAGDLRPPRCSMISAEAAVSRPSRCTVTYTSLETSALPRAGSHEEDGEMQEPASQHRICKRICKRNTMERADTRETRQTHGDAHPAHAEVGGNE